MKELIDKLSSYNLFNYLLPGVLFAVVATELTTFNFLIENVLVGAFVYYFYGVVISRIGSLLLEPALKRFKIIEFAPYSEFIEAAKQDPTIVTLSEQNNSYRSLAALLFCLIVLFGIDLLQTYFMINAHLLDLIAVLILFALFLASYYKQTTYIKKRISAALISKENGSKDEANHS